MKALGDIYECCGEINYDEISRITLCPINIFQRFFALNTGITLTEYIRSRKLSEAAHELQCTNNKIIDISSKYGYDSSDAFCVAFKRLYDVTPSEARQLNKTLKLYFHLFFSLSIKQIQGDVIVKNICELVANVNKPEICEMPDVRFIGKYTRTNPPELWDKCFSDGTIDVLISLPHIINDALMGISCDFNPEDGTNGYIMGVMTPADTPIPDGFMHKDLPATLVAKGVFGEDIKTTIKRFDELGYDYNWSNDLNTGWNGEIYFKDDPNNDTWSNLIPIRKKV